ncbi:hypothetical protein [Acidocella sp.]|uniref:hypothetical protein n=1 Tax=Acidocella sp. TaxID=50710 RepID=UPI002625CE26|nr:hypothetical protein [Acidocella sp.]
MTGINLYEAYKKHVLDQSTFEEEREVAFRFIRKFIDNEFYATGWRSGEYQITRIEREFWNLLMRVLSNNTSSDGIEIDYINERLIKKEGGNTEVIYRNVSIYEEPYENEKDANDVRQSAQQEVDKCPAEHGEEIAASSTAATATKTKRVRVFASKLSSKFLIKMDNNEYGQVRRRLEEEAKKQEYRTRASILESLSLIDELRKPEHRELSQKEVISILSDPAPNRRRFTPSTVQKIYSGNYDPFENFVRKFYPVTVPRKPSDS